VFTSKDLDNEEQARKPIKIGLQIPSDGSMIFTGIPAFVPPSGVEKKQQQETPPQES
jgi:hypothetical protein